MGLPSGDNYNIIQLYSRYIIRTVIMFNSHGQLYVCVSVYYVYIGFIDRYPVISVFCALACTCHTEYVHVVGLW